MKIELKNANLPYPLAENFNGIYNDDITPGIFISESNPDYSVRIFLEISPGINELALTKTGSRYAWYQSAGTTITDFLGENKYTLATGGTQNITIDIVLPLKKTGGGQLL